MAGASPGLTVSRIALGCGNFGGVGSAPEFFGRGLTEDEAFALMDAAPRWPGSRSAGCWPMSG
jgi:aryl-alcohol dehydrogenase-like predicted oxidoreductase